MTSTCTASSRDAEVCAVFARYGYSPADDSPFANRIFDPAAVDAYYDAPTAVKQMLLGYHRNTNYSVVDAELIKDLYRRVYQEKVTGRERLRIMQACRVVASTTPGRRRSRSRGARVAGDGGARRTGLRRRDVCDRLSPGVPARAARPAHALCTTGEDGMVCRP